MKSPIGVIVFLSIMFLLDLYVFQSVKTLAQSVSPKNRSAIVFIYWSISVLSCVGFLLFVYTNHHFLGKSIRTYLFATIMGFFLAKLMAILFFVADDVRRSIQWTFGKFFSNNTITENANDSISRSAFISWLGIAAGGSLFGSLLYGFGNKYNYQITHQKLQFNNLPSSFKGLKIVHISDIHSGSFLDKKAVERGIEKIIQQKADLILFTGDLVNDMATEVDSFKDLFCQLKAPLGVYSVLGNHDYGDYVQWPIEGISKEQNLQNLQQVHADLGWRLLMNEHVVIEKNNEQIALLGIENWSAKARFPKHGKMNEAHAGTEKYPFKILLSHDPSHWQAEVLPHYKKVDLTLSGHTHGMQFGFEIPGVKWSPIQYLYKEWAGLYESADQKLYVNRGFGFLGYPGRVGVLPEITVLELI